MAAKFSPKKSKFPDTSRFKRPTGIRRVMGSNFPEMSDYCFRIIRDNVNAICL